MFRLVFPLVLVASTVATSHAEDFQGSTHVVPYDEEIINYSATRPGGPIAELQEKIDSGKVKLRFDEKFGWLPALLEVLKVPKSSQMLVFSKTSLQRAHISPKNPRALYYNDDVYLGYVPGAPLMEVSAVDPQLGGVFYHVEQTPERKPRFVRDADCLSCHVSSRTLGVPGHFVRSVGTDATGELESGTEVSHIEHTTPFADRWAGWLVTGTHGDMTHRGNLIGSADFERAAERPNYKGNLTSLDGFIRESDYVGRGSDVVALMVLEHQGHMHNYLTRLNYETRTMMAQYGHTRYLTKKVDAFLRYLLFTEEAPLTAPVAGNPEFVRDFAALGPRDPLGRSLREFDLQTRLFKYPCSFLIYSPAFDAIPEPMRGEIYRRLWDILHGRDASPDFANLPEDRRHAIRDILLATKKGLPEYWKGS
jgi:hypothetical protein